jgi:hypothetical protein
VSLELATSCVAFSLLLSLSVLCARETRIPKDHLPARADQNFMQDRLNLRHLHTGLSVATSSSRKLPRPQGNKRRFSCCSLVLSRTDPELSSFGALFSSLIHHINSDGHIANNPQSSQVFSLNKSIITAMSFGLSRTLLLLASSVNLYPSVALFAHHIFFVAQT